jgi:HEAT repeat protein
MIALGHPAAQVVWMPGIALSILIASLSAFIFVRRAIHSAAFRRPADAAATLAPWIDGLLSGLIEYETGLGKLAGHSRTVQRIVLERLPSVEWEASPDRLSRLKRICADFGLVTEWRRQLARQRSGWAFSSLFEPGLRPLERIPGLHFVARAEAAENLGIIRDEPSWPLLVEALDDPHLTVRSVAARALAGIQAPESFPALAQKLQSAALGLGRNLSVRTLKMTLASFPMDRAADLGGLLHHTHRRVRFLAADVIATMTQREAKMAQQIRPSPSAVPAPIAEIFLTAFLTDDNPDVRARAADVIGPLEDRRAERALLLLLDDAEWFVRLHATRALAERRPLDLAPLGRRLTDSNWRVREAAVQTLAAQGDRGVRLLLTHFLSTEDRYSRDQVAEHMERMGLIPSLLAAFGEPGAERETRFIEGIIHLGRTAALSTALQNGMAYKRATLLTELRRHADSPERAFAQQLQRMPEPFDLRGQAARPGATLVVETDLQGR